MATATILPNGLTKNTGWGTGALTDIDEGIASIDGSLLQTGSDGEGDQITVDFASPGLSDGDTLTQCDVRLHHGTGGADVDSVLNVEFLIGGVAQGVTQSPPNRSSLTTDTVNHSGWNSDWTASQIDGVQVRITCAQAGMPVAERFDLDALEIVITYTPGSSGTEIIIPAANLELSTTVPGSFPLQNGADFDGANDWLDASTPSSADATDFSAVVFFKPDNSLGQSRIIHASGSRVRLMIPTSGQSGGLYKLQLQLLTSASVVVVNIQSDFVFPHSEWNVVFVSYDSVAQTAHFWNHDTDIEDAGFGARELNTGTANLSVEWSIGADLGGNQKFAGGIGPLWATNEFIDFSSSANRDKFLDSDGRPNLAGIGADGSIPTGTQPLYWLWDVFSSYHTNDGSAADFTVNGSLTDEGTGPLVTLSSNVSIEIPAANLQLSTTAASLDLGVLPAAANLQLSTTVPVLTPGQVREPPAAQLELSSTVPVLSQGLVRQPPAGQLEISSTAPDISVPVGITIPAANLQISTTAPAVLFGFSIEIPAGQLELSTTAASILTPVGVSIPAANLALSTTAPSIALDKEIIIPAAQIQVSTSAPSIGIDRERIIPAAQLELSTTAPEILTPVGISIPAANLELSATAPAVLLGFTIEVPAANLELSTTVPDLLLATNRVPAAANLELSTTAPTIEIDREITIPAANLEVSTTAPVLTPGIVRTPPAANLELSTTTPVLTPGLVRQPPAGQLEFSTTAPSISILGGDVSIEVPAAQLELSTFAPLLDVPSLAGVAKHNQGTLVGLKHMMGM